MESFRFAPRCERLDGPLARLSPFESLVRLAPEVERPILFEGTGSGTSLLVFDPLPLETPATLAELERALACLVPLGALPPGFPDRFHGGFAGALAYELGSAEDPALPLPADPWGFPRIVGGLYTDFLVKDERSGANWLCLGETSGDARAPFAERRERILALLARERAPAPALAPLGPLVRRTPRAAYLAAIERVQEAIRRGDVYQVNLSHRFERAVRGDPLVLYARLRALHPAPYLGYARFDEGAILSASPELLLEFGADERGAFALTQPIKGTLARGKDPADDRARAARLAASAKDLAELAMIVDLERNDLGRIARAGGVEVLDFPHLLSTISVHHLAADVRARPRPGVGAVECLRALFPGGSVTGAPKLASMEMIAALEGEGRGFAYGSLFFLDVRGRACANLLIRTLLWRPRPDLGAGAGELTFRVGGGITLPSDPALEEEETLAKGEALMRVLEPAAADGAEPGADPDRVWLSPRADVLF